MAVDDRLDVPLEARLRPAALVVAARNVGSLVHQRDEAAAVEPIHVAALPTDVSDERAVAPADDSRERSEIELGSDASLVVHG